MFLEFPKPYMRAARKQIIDEHFQLDAAMFNEVLDANVHAKTAGSTEGAMLRARLGTAQVFYLLCGHHGQLPPIAPPPLAATVRAAQTFAKNTEKDPHRKRKVVNGLIGFEQTITTAVEMTQVKRTQCTAFAVLAERVMRGGCERDQLKLLQDLSYSARMAHAAELAERGVSLTPMWGQRGSPDVRNVYRFMDDSVHICVTHEELNRKWLMRAETAADNAGACLYFGFAEDCILECSQTSGRRIGGERLRRAAEKALAAGTLSGPEERMGASVADLPRVWAYWVGQKVTLATTAEYQEVYSRKSHQNTGFSENPPPVF